jgi:hypothetical protein
VFDAIVNSGVRLFPGAMITVARPDGGTCGGGDRARGHHHGRRMEREIHDSALPRSLHAAAILDAKLIDFRTPKREGRTARAGRRATSF